LIDEVMKPESWPAAERTGPRIEPSASSSSPGPAGPSVAVATFIASASSGLMPTAPAICWSKTRAPDDTLRAKISRPPRTNAMSMLSEPMSSSITAPGSVPYEWWYAEKSANEFGTASRTSRFDFDSSSIRSST
jgi:hypothetical protein